MINEPNISKGLTNPIGKGDVSVPSLASSKIKINYKPVPTLHNFVKSYATIENRNTGIYKLKRCYYREPSTSTYVSYTVITYKLGNTKYFIHSCTKFTIPKKQPVINEGYIKISKGLFKSKKFNLKELPKNVIDSINNNIELFNGRYVLKLGEIELKKIKAANKKEKDFFEGLNI